MSDSLKKSLQDAVLEKLSDQVQQSLDFGIKCAFMEEEGWTIIEIDYIPDSAQSWINVINWADTTFGGQWEEHKGTWVIENAQDATMFALRWKVKR